MEETHPQAAPVSDDDEARDHFQTRLRLYLAVMLAFVGGALVFVQALTIAFFADRLWEVSLAPGRIVHMIAALMVAAAWLASRRLHLSLPAMRRMEVGCTLAFVVLFALDLGLNKPADRPELILVIVLGNALTVRAALVPSTGRRSFALAGVAFAAALLSAAAVYAPTGDRATLALRLLWTSLFMSMALAGTALASRVIYGLRQRERAAMRLGQYVLENELGSGGMGVVYRAHHALLKRPTAVKLILPDKARPESIARFEREVRLTARLTHPNTVAIFDYGRTAEGIFYYAMEFLEGLTLEQLVARDGPQKPARVAYILRQICQALAEAHSIGLVHRDIKPANVILCERGGMSDVVKVLDFGLVKDLKASSDSMTENDSVVGTPHYMAPEAIRDPDRVDHRADLYALGALAYCLMTGSPPFSGTSVVEVCSHHLHTIPVPPSKRMGREIEPRLEAIVMRCLSKQPDQRPASATDLALEIEECELSWHQHEARSWWRSYQPAAEKSVSAADTERLATLTVDVAKLRFA